jgi:hypothetical protein
VASLAGQCTHIPPFAYPAGLVPAGRFQRITGVVRPSLFRIAWLIT